jgi:hypothetical protein
MALSPQFFREAVPLSQLEKDNDKFGVKLLIRPAFLADKRDSFIKKLFHFVCKKRLKDWRLVEIVNKF